MKKNENTDKLEFKKYTLNTKDNIYTNITHKSLGYEDGAEIELLRILDKVTDKSTLSDELAVYMQSWPFEYHLSKKRHLIIKKYDIKKGDKVLELGAGCGAITRYLAEIGAEVTAVEGEYNRAKVIAKRCDGFKNVSIVVDNILNYETEIKYDWVLMIGVLEYSTKYGKTENPVEEYLNVAKNKLNDNGKLLIAIENKLGIKYINGAGEDHNGKLFYGTQDLYADKDITTWGSEELKDILYKVGFEDVNISGVFPDYKLPKVILDENINKNREFRAEELILYVKSLDYQGKNNRIFDESLFASALRKNGLLIHLSNSFLIEAGARGSDQSAEEKILAHYYSVERKNKFATSTKFCLSKNGISVRKENLKKNQESNIEVLDDRGNVYSVKHSINNIDEKYINGRSLGFLFTQINASEKHEILSEVLIRWATNLMENFKFYVRGTGEIIKSNEIKGRNLSDVLIDGKALDCGPQNIIIGTEDTCFDLEWECNIPIPFAWVLNRNSNHINRHAYVAQGLLTNENIVGLMCDYFGLDAFTEDIKEAKKMEMQFQMSVSNPEPSSNIGLTKIQW